VLLLLLLLLIFVVLALSFHPFVTSVQAGIVLGIPGWKSISKASRIFGSNDTISTTKDTHSAFSLHNSSRSHCSPKISPISFIYIVTIYIPPTPSPPIPHHPLRPPPLNLPTPPRQIKNMLVRTLLTQPPQRLLKLIQIIPILPARPPALHDFLRQRLWILRA